MIKISRIVRVCIKNMIMCQSYSYRQIFRLLDGVYTLLIWVGLAKEQMGRNIFGEKGVDYMVLIH